MNWHKDTVFMKSVKLNEAFIGQMTLTEMRIIQMAMVDLCRSSDAGDDRKRVVKIHSTQYRHHYGVLRGGACAALRASVNIKEREFSFKDSPNLSNKWVDSISYAENEGVLSLVFSDEVLNEIPHRCNVNAIDKYVTLDLTDTAKFSSMFAMRLFEILMQWKGLPVSPAYLTKDLRQMMGASASKYPRNTDFKRVAIARPLEVINKTLGWSMSMQLKKKGRVVDSITFLFDSPISNTQNQHQTQETKHE